MKYKEGDKVKIIPFDKIKSHRVDEENYISNTGQAISIPPTMRKYFGKEVEIKSRDFSHNKDRFYTTCGWWFLWEWVEQTTPKGNNLV